MPTHKTPVSTYTTIEARNDWKTMYIMEFLSKYHVSHANAYKALGHRDKIKNVKWQLGHDTVERIGRKKIADVVEKMGISFASRHFSIGIRVIRTHILGISLRTPSVKKWKQPGVGLI